jgi:uncharacterized coiled-coil DUF342 family protein
MASNTTKKQAEAKSEGEKKVRRQLTDAERVAKLEADLEAARNKAKVKAEKKANVLVEQRNALTAKIADLKAKVDAINLELDSLGHVDQPAEDVPAEAGTPEGE